MPQRRAILPYIDGVLQKQKSPISATCAKMGQTTPSPFNPNGDGASGEAKGVS